MPEPNASPKSGAMPAGANSQRSPVTKNRIPNNSTNSFIAVLIIITRGRR